MATATKSATRQEAESARAGIKAGAKARRRERTQEDAAIGATLTAEKSGRGRWTYTYRADGESRTGTVVENARREVAAAELLRMAREAARLAAARLRSRHGIPALSGEEVSDLASDLVVKLLGEAAPHPLPARERLTKSYLVTRCEGLVLNDPARRADQELPDADQSPADLAAQAESQARAKGSRRDPMLTLPGERIERMRQGRKEAAIVPADLDPVNPSLRAGLAASELPSKASRAAAYLVHGGTVADDWSRIWGTTDGYAKTRIVPEGCALLRELPAAELADLAAAIATAAAPDRLDRRERARAQVAAGLRPSPDRARAVKPWRDRTDAGDRAGRIGPAVPTYRVTTRTDKRIIVSSDRTRAKMAKRNGWTEPSR